MKNSIKKVLCTAVAAVSLSALVTVPSSLNKPDSDNAIVNVMEADSKFETYRAYMTEDTSGKNRYYVRSSKSKKDDSNIIRNEYAYYQFTVYEQTNDWVRISPDGKSKEWVWRNRVKQIYPNAVHNCANCNDAYDYMADVYNYYYWYKNNYVCDTYTVNYHRNICTVCCKKSKKTIDHVYVTPYNGKTHEVHWSSECPQEIKERINNIKNSY